MIDSVPWSKRHKNRSAQTARRATPYKLPNPSVPILGRKAAHETKAITRDCAPIHGRYLRSPKMI